MNKEKIEEILLKHSPYVFFGNAVKTELFGETVKHLTTLIQAERKDAVIGFAYYLLKRRNKDEFWGLSEGEVEMAMIVAKQYLESEGKE